MTQTSPFSRIGASFVGSSLVLAVLLVLTPVTSRAMGEVGLQWSAENLALQIVGEIAPEAGYEAIATDALASTRLYRLVDGVPLSNIPSPFQDDRRTTYRLRDIDADGLAEIVCLYHDDLAGGAAVLGCLDYERGALLRLWPNTPLPDRTSSIDFMDLSSTEPFAIIVWDPLRIYSSRTGQLLFDAASVIGAEWEVASMVTDDFDQDGFEEALVQFQIPGSPGSGGAWRIDLIGDLSTATSTNAFSVGNATLLQNRPNPTNGPTSIAYDLRRNARVRLRVFDSAGRRVSTLIDEQVLAGHHQTIWNGRDDHGNAVASGIYFYELDVEGEKSTRKLVQVR